MITSYDGLLERLVAGKVKFALAGGLAVCLNGFVRTTVDVDILVDNSPENIARLCECLAEFGEGHGRDLTPLDLPNEPGAVRIVENFDLDIFVQMSGKTLADFAPLVGYYTLRSGVQIPFLKAAALIETKAGSVRDKDRSDIGALRDMARSKSDKTILSPGFSLDSIREEPDPE
jgi:hypothetical protein